MSKLVLAAPTEAQADALYDDHRAGNPNHRFELKLARTIHRPTLSVVPRGYDVSPKS